MKTVTAENIRYGALMPTTVLFKDLDDESKEFLRRNENCCKDSSHPIIYDDNTPVPLKAPDFVPQQHERINFDVQDNIGYNDIIKLIESNTGFYVLSCSYMENYFTNTSVEHSPNIIPLSIFNKNI